jgi:glycosyltransferase involved in cell wall biosynthesis
MKVLSANKFFFLKGGSERVFFQEREFLAGQGIKLIDFAMQDARNLYSHYSEYFVSHCDYHGESSLIEKFRQAVTFIHSQEAVSKLTQLVKKEKPQIAHLHNIYHQLTPSIIPVLKDHGVKVLLTLHDGKLICPNYLMLNKGKFCTACGGRHFWKAVTHRCMGSSRHDFLLMIESYWHLWKNSYESVDVFISPSRFLADLVAQRIPKSKIRLLLHGVDPSEFQGVPQDEGYALFFGRLSEEKGIRTLLKAHRALGDELELKIVGTGPLEDELRNAYPGADFLGYMQGQELKDIISKSAYVVVPSEGCENSTMAVLEAMAAAKPVIGSNIASIPEQIDDRLTGFLFPPGDVDRLTEKMRTLWQDASLRKNMGMEARRKAERKYSLENHLQYLLKIYRELISTANH